MNQSRLNNLIILSAYESKLGKIDLIEKASTICW